MSAQAVAARSARMLKPAVIVVGPVVAALATMGVLAAVLTYGLVGSQLSPGPPSATRMPLTRAKPVNTFMASDSEICAAMAALQALSALR